MEVTHKRVRAWKSGHPNSPATPPHLPLWPGFLSIKQDMGCSLQAFPIRQQDSVSRAWASIQEE